ncbi:MAG: endonuclease V [Elusimicrobiota bacterium]
MSKKRNMDYKQEKIIQKRLKEKTDFKNYVSNPCYVAGADVFYNKENSKVRAGCAVFRYPSLELIETESAEFKNSRVFPYVPGLLAFREMPFIKEVLNRVNSPIDVLVADGQGRLHPLEMGLAVHLGITIQKPTIGCAKNHFYGKEKDVENEKGAYSFITDNGKKIGVKLRTKKDTKPLYVSQGWGISLNKCMEIILGCCRGYRIPEVIRKAHKEANL